MARAKLTRIFALILTLLMLTPAASAAMFGKASLVSPKTTVYTDVPSTHWAFVNIMNVSSKNWFSGYPDGSFRPNGTITRAEAAKVFVSFLGCNVPSVSSSSFSDVDVNKWYAPFIEAGKTLFPTSAQEELSFRPEEPITREDTVYALVNALGFTNGIAANESLLNAFTDQSSISQNIRKHFAIALRTRLISGYPDNTIRPQNTLTRAEFAAILHRGSMVVTIKPSRIAPTLKVADYPAHTVSESVTITGTVTDSSSFPPTLTCNGEPVTVDNTSFSVTVPLSEGKNRITFFAQSMPNGGTAEKTIAIIRLAGESIRLTVAGKVYSLGMTEAELTALAGSPVQTLPSTTGRTWYVFGTSTYRDFLLAGLKNDKVVALASAGPAFSYLGRTAGDQAPAATDCADIYTDKNDNYIFHAVQLREGYADHSAKPTEAQMHGESILNFHMTNAFRLYHGLRPFVWSDPASWVAVAHSQDMADRDYFSHTNLDGRSPGDRLTAAGIQWRRYGENIAAGRRTGIDTYDGWVNSAGHRTNMLMDCRSLGVGLAYNENSKYGYYMTQNFITER